MKDKMYCIWIIIKESYLLAPAKKKFENKIFIKIKQKSNMIMKLKDSG